MAISDDFAQNPRHHEEALASVVIQAVLDGHALGLAMTANVNTKNGRE
ncbi:MAG: hypothetical protein V4482_02680 [Pseudomonadota bacterium]